MAMGRGFRAFQINPGINANKENSIILEQRGKNEVILFENYALASLATQEFESMRKNYTKIVDAYGCLGVLVRKLTLEQDDVYVRMRKVSGPNGIGDQLRRPCLSYMLRP